MDVNKIGSEHTQGIRVSCEWSNTEMSVSGECTASQNNWCHRQKFKTQNQWNSQCMPKDKM